jgi:hypothetical protein
VPLEEADLVIVRRGGRERWNHLNPLPIKHIDDRLIAPMPPVPLDMLERLQTDLEGDPCHLVPAKTSEPVSLDSSSAQRNSRTKREQ